MKRFSFGSLRVRLILLVLLAVIPVMGITLYSDLELRDHMRQHALEDAQRLAKDISEDHDRLIQNAYQILSTLSKTSEVQKQDKTACSEVFADIVKQSQGYAALGAIKPNGDLFAYFLPIPRPVNYSDRPWFQRVLKTRDFVIGEYLIGRVTGKPMIVLAHPVFDDKGNLTAILSLGMDLEWLNKTILKSKLQEGTSVSVIDSNGTVLFRYPEPEKYVGKSMPEASIVKAMLAKRNGVEETVGIDGVPRLFGFTSLGKGVESVHVTVGIPSQIALAKTDRVMKDKLAYLGLVVLLALAAAWYLGGFFIIHPVNRLLDTTKQLANGDLTVRTGPPYREGEIGQLALAFDQMATSLEQREAERKQAEEMLQRNEERFRSLVIATAQVVWTTNAIGEVVEDIPSWRAFTGQSEQEIKGWGWINAVHPDDHQRTAAIWSHAVETHSLYETEYRVRRHDEEYRYFAVRGVPISEKDGNIREWVGTCTDITERKRTEEEKASLQEQLRQSQKVEAIGQLAGGIAHDFNNLLTIIKGYGQLSLHELQKDDPLRENIGEIQEAADRAAALTRQLLAFSRRQIMEMKVLDLNDLIRNLEKMLRRVIGEDVELVTFLAEDLGRVKADPGQIEQVIINLAVNARDAMPTGGKLTIETANVELDEAYSRNHVAVKPGRYVMFSVSDTGVGMTPEVRERGFEPFFTTKEKGKGTGLGLSTVYGIVKQSGGNIWVYSELGRGTTFKIYLPRVDEPQEEIGVKTSDKEEFPRGNETVLVVEDEEEVRKLTVRILRKQGYKVLEAPEGLEAFLICEEHEGPIHLLVTDVVMPKMSGRELADRIVSIRPEIKVLYMSGYTDNAIVHHGVLREGVSFVQKPFTIEGLAKKVREVLDKDLKPAV